MNWLRRQYDDIKGHAKWAMLCGLWWVITTGIKKLLFLIPNIPNGLVWSILVALSLITFWLVAKWDPLTKKRPELLSQAGDRTEILNPGMPTLSALTGKTTALDNLTSEKLFGNAYFSPLTAEVEKNIRVLAEKISPNDKEKFYLRFIGVGVASYMHDMTWWTILKTQLLFLIDLNTKGVVPIAESKKFYDQGNYPNYPFEAWLRWMERELLIIRHPTDMLEITHKSKDFLKYLAHWGRNADLKPN